MNFTKIACLISIFPFALFAQDDYWRQQNLKNDEVRNAEQRQRDIDNSKYSSSNSGTGSWDNVGNNIAEFILNKNKKVEVEYDWEYEEYSRQLEADRLRDEMYAEMERQDADNERQRKLNSPIVTQRYKDGAVYEGQMYNDDGKFNGKGKLKLANGTLYEGTFENDEFIKGTVSHPNGAKIEGSFSTKKETNVKITFSDGVIYEGEIRNFQQTGKGKMIFPDGTTQKGWYVNGQITDYAEIVYNSDTEKGKKGDKYQGEIFNGKKHGRGKYTHASGQIDDGYWVDGNYVGSTPPQGEMERVFVDELIEGKIPNGHYKVNKVINGNSYYGYMYQNKKEGFGKLTQSDGEILEGIFANDVFIKGIQMYADGSTKYEGTWKNGNYFGEGTLYKPNGDVKKYGYWNNGEFVTNKRDKFEIEVGHTTSPLNIEKFLGNAIYEGELNKNRKPHGFGIMKLASGSVYEGQLSNGFLHGKGKLIFADKNSIYEGDFVEDNRTGKGVLRFLKENMVYEGDFVNGYLQGKGKIVFGNGDYYEGDYHNSMRFGNGKYVFADGQTFEGEHKRNKFDGQGKMTYPDGTVKVGIWKEGVFQEN